MTETLPDSRPVDTGERDDLPMVTIPLLDTYGMDFSRGAAAPQPLDGGSTGDTETPPVANGAAGEATPSNTVPSSESVENDTGEAPKREVEAIERKDAEARYTDTELLGRSYPVRRSVRATGRGAAKVFHSAIVKTRNLAATPGKARRQIAYNLAKNSFDRRTARLASAKSERLQRHRRRAVMNARIAMNARRTKLEDHVTTMEKRSEAVSTRAVERRDKYIGDLKAKREAALARKTVRQGLRQEGASRRETRTILAEVAPHMKRIGRVAIEREAAHRRFNKADRADERAGAKLRRTETRLNNLEGRVGLHDEADRTVQAISTTRLPEAQAEVEALSEKLSGLEEGSLDYDLISADLEGARSKVESYAASLRHWQEVADSRTRKSDRVDYRLRGTYDRHDQRSVAAAATAEELQRQRAAVGSKNEELDNVLYDALNPSRARKGR